MKRVRSALGLITVCVVVAAVAVPLSGCSTLRLSSPSCGAQQRLALVAQSVPAASFIPCVGQLPAGWSVPTFAVEKGETRFSLVSDRAEGRPVRVRFTPSCLTTGAALTSSRAPGTATYLKVSEIDPNYAGTLYDVFPGGCVSYTFSFARGQHIPLVLQFEGAVLLESRHQLRSELLSKYGLHLDR